MQWDEGVVTWLWMHLIILFLSISVYKLGKGSFSCTEAFVRSYFRNNSIHQDHYFIYVWQEAHAMSHQDTSLYRERESWPQVWNYNSGLWNDSIFTYPDVPATSVSNISNTLLWILPYSNSSSSDSILRDEFMSAQLITNLFFQYSIRSNHFIKEMLSHMRVHSRQGVI